jgi:hypothetical protein
MSLSASKFISAATVLEARAQDIEETQLMDLGTAAKEKRFKRRIGVELDEYMFHQLNAEEEELSTARRWAAFDCFFTFIVCLNAVYIGLEVDGYIEKGSSLATQLELTFLMCFICEYAIRFFANPGRTLTSAWCWLDLFVIVTGLIDPVSEMFELEASGSGDFGVVKLFRALRLLRLLRLVKLVHFFRELLLLVSASLAALKTLLWTCVLLTASMYVVSIITLDEMTRTRENEPRLVDTDPQLMVWYGTLQSCMLTMLQITTSDDLHMVLSTTGGTRWWLGVILFFFWTFSSLGILNLVVGAMVHAAMSSAKQQENFDNMSELFHQQEKLIVLWETLRTAGMRPVFDDPNTMTKEEMLQCLSTPEVDKMLRSMHIRHDDVIAIMAACRKASGRLETDGFIEGLCRRHGTLRPADIWCWIAHLEVLSLEIKRLQGGSTRVLALLHGLEDHVEKRMELVLKHAGEISLVSTTDAVDEKAAHHFTGLEISNSAQARLKYIHDHARTRYLAEELTVKQDSLKNAKERLWARFDSFFGIFVIVQGACSGLRLLEGMEQYQAEFRSMDTLMFFVFAFEFPIRYKLSREEHQRIKHHPSLNWIWRSQDKLPEPDNQIPGHCKFFWSVHMTEFFNIFDLVVLGFSIQDLFLAEGTSKAWLRVIRILRITRVIRVFRLFRELYILWSAIQISLDTLGWVIFVLVLLCYVVCIMVLELLDGKMHPDNPDVHIFENNDQVKEWTNGMSKTMLTLMQVVTYDDWPKIIRSFTEVPEVLCALVIFLIFARLNVLNFLVGMLCYSAHTVMEEESTAKFRNEVTAVRYELDKEAGGFNKDSPSNEHFITEKTVHHLFEHPSIKAASGRLGLAISDALSVLRKLDPGAEGRVNPDAFIEGCVRLGTAPEGEDIYHLKVICRQVELELVETSSLLVDIVEDVEIMLTQISRLSEVVALRKQAAMNQMRQEPAKVVPETVRRLQEIHDSATSAASTLKDVKDCPDEADTLPSGYTAFMDQTPRTIHTMALTPRSCWTFLQWAGAPSRAEYEQEDANLEDEIEHLSEQVQILEEELQRREMNEAVKERLKKAQERAEAD